jgi:hypothetical protein
MQSATLTREQLFELAWSEPMRTLAPRYGLSDVGLAKICREMRIPLPWRGYWQQKAAGKEVSRPVLPPLPAGSPAHLNAAVLTPSVRSTPEEGPVAEQRRYESLPDHRIVVPERLTRSHPLVEQTRVVLRQASVDERGVPWAWNKRYLDVHVTRGSLDRALRIMDALLKALEKRGFSVQIVMEGKDAKTKVRIDEDEVKIRLDERTRRVERKPKSGEKWVYPQYGFLPTGHFTLRIDSYLGDGAQLSWSDGKQQRLEERLNDFVVGLVAWAEREKERRQEREHREREWKEAEQRRLESKRRQEEENARIGELERKVVAWVKSGQVRDFVTAVRARMDEADEVEDREALERWTEWALAYADRLDPLLNGDWRALQLPPRAPSRPS